MSKSGDDDDRTWEPTKAGRSSKRIKLIVKPPREPTNPTIVFTSAFRDTPLPAADDFEQLFPKDEYIATRHKCLKEASERDIYNNQIRPLTSSEIHGLRVWLDNSAAAGRQTWTFGEAILKRRLALRKLQLSESPIFSYDVLFRKRSEDQDLHHVESLSSRSSPNNETLDALNSVTRTPFPSSFSCRILGRQSNTEERNVVHRDWETQSLWMDLLSDIKLYHTLMHPKDDLVDVIAPIEYVTLQHWHLRQLHDLLSRIFWPGIDVSDSLQFSPEKCTIIAKYKWLVVGAAILSSPEETYLTYLVVRPGWESANIASTMLYLLIKKNPKKDITLHVSANNPAMVLYNKFGFKAEEFIVGFYEDYLPKDSKSCKNAFRLRLRS